MLDSRDIAILRILDGASNRAGWIPTEKVLDKIAWSPMKIKPRIRGLEREHLLHWRTQFGETSLRLTDKGRDALAVWDFKTHGLLTDIGNIIDVGKESVLVNATGPKGDFIIKFHRYDALVFDRIKRSLSYMSIALRLPMANNVDVSRVKARIEYDTLKALDGKVTVPKVFGLNRHAIAMEFIGDRFPAPLLKDVKIEKGTKKQVFEEYQKAIDAGYVHGDMSEYNVMCWDGKYYLIDWPQSLPTSCDFAKTLEKRDREKLESFFSRPKKGRNA